MAPSLESLGIDKLTVDERIELARAILASVDAEVEQAPLTDVQMAELERRLEAHRQNPEVAIPWEEIRDAARARFRK